MYSDAVEALLAMGEYIGTLENFISASTTTIQDVLKCSPAQADRVLQDLRQRNTVIFDFVSEADLPLTTTGVPISCWYWRSPDAA